MCFAVAAGVNLGYALNWTVGYLANRPDLQEAAYNAICEVYGDAPPDPHDVDRVEFVKALHLVSPYHQHFLCSFLTASPRKDRGFILLSVSAFHARHWRGPHTEA